MKSIFLALCLLPLLAGSAFAKDIKIPSDDPIASVTLPAGWTSEETDNGISCQSEDGAATIVFDVADAKNFDALIQDNVKYLNEQKVTIDKSSEKEREFEAAGMKWSAVEYSGNDEYGPEHIQLMAADIKPGKVLMITYWVTQKAEAGYADEILALLGSLKKL